MERYLPYLDFVCRAVSLRRGRNRSRVFERDGHFCDLCVLVVILIISVLAGLLLVAISISIQHGKIRRTEALLASIQGAVQSYQSDFRDFPFTDSDDGVEGGEQLYAALRNRDKAAPETDDGD